jgi:hypothetical protein
MTCSGVTRDAFFPQSKTFYDRFTGAVHHGFSEPVGLNMAALDRRGGPGESGA